jgi:two-component system cell cycle sensor histidine kinase/response regulator CckA
MSVPKPTNAERLYKKAFESCRIALVITDQDGRIVLANPQAEVLFGSAQDELLGRTCDELTAQVSRTGAMWDITHHSLPTEQGAWTLCSIVDVSERRRAQAALQESEDRFRAMADNSPVMIGCSGPDKLATFFNQRWLEFTGRKIEQEIGYGWIDTVHPEDRDRTWASYSASFDSRSPSYVECRLRRADGEYRTITCTGIPRFAPDGVFAGYIASCTDTTDIRQAQEQGLAHQKWESVGLLANGIAHDFNNLLGGILASAELALSAPADSAVVEEELLRIKSATTRGSETVRQLMIYSGKEGVERELVDFVQLIAEMRPLLEVSVPKNIKLETALSANPPSIKGNPAQLRQLVMNLVVNASESIGDRASGDKNGTVRISAAPLRQGFIQLEVSDTGSGMTPEVQDKMFDPFFSTKFAGRGLGLAVVQGIVRNHDAAIVVVSEEGKGTSFQIDFPSAAEQVPQARRQSAVPAKPRGARTVLVVEDEELLRQAVSKALALRGVVVLEAGDGSAAMDLIRARAGEIDAVLLDMTIPGTSSRQIVEEVRRLRPGLEVILTSAYPQETAVKAFAGLGIERFIRKPYHLADLTKLFPQTQS